MVELSKNSLDLLRFFAAALVLYSHQHALLGLNEPQLFDWTSLGGVGVSIFFFLSGMLVWSSWARDPDLQRFFIRRCLRIFPALWFVVLGTVLFLGPMLSELATPDFFSSTQTWRYLGTALLIVRQGLPGVFNENPYPDAINGSLWTLPVEFLCYISVAVIGSMGLIPKKWLMGLGMSLVVLATALGSKLVGIKFAPHLEMVAFFWWGVMYAFIRERPSSEYKGWALGCGVALIAFLLLGGRGVERTGMLILAAVMVIGAQHVSWGARITDHLGDLSYGMYIFAFPVQQTIVALGRHREWSFSMHLSLSFAMTSVLAYVSWHGLEKQALRLKPSRRVSS